MNLKSATILMLFLASCSKEAPSSIEATDTSVADASGLGEPQKDWSDEADFSKCMENVDLGAFKNSQWQACHEDALKRFDGELNAAYSKLIGQLETAEDIERLRKAQRAWVTFRDPYCDFEGKLDTAPSPEINRLSCLLDLTHTQTGRLKDST